MKNNIIISNLLLSSMIILFSLSACDEINEPYKFPDYGYDSTGIETGKTITDTVGNKVVLLEDFTGHTCVNCPKAHDKAKELLEKYLNRLVVMAVHEGPFAEPQANTPYTYDFRVLPTVNDWNQVWGIRNYPQGLINRLKFNGTFVTNYTSWDSKIESIINEQPEVIIKITNIYNSTKMRYSTRIVSNFNKDLQGNHKLSVCIIEDGIIKPQKFTGSHPDSLLYEHNHVLRGVVNSTWGTTIGTENITNGSKFTKWFGITTKSDWEKKKLFIVAFIYNTDDYHVLQAAIAPLDIRE